MPHPSLSKPLSSDECIEMDELLAQLDESSYAMDASQADGFLTALCLLPQEVSPTEWMPKIFCAPEATPSRLPDTQQNRLEELINADKIIRPAYKDIVQIRKYEDLEDR